MSARLHNFSSCHHDTIQVHIECQYQSSTKNHMKRNICLITDSLLTLTQQQMNLSSLDIKNQIGQSQLFYFEWQIIQYNTRLVICYSLEVLWLDGVSTIRD